MARPNVITAVRSWVIRCLAWAPLRRLALRAFRRRYVRRWPVRASQIFDRILLLQQPDVAQRRDTVADLVELFFDVCSLRNIDLFIEAGAKEASASQRAASEIGVERAVAFEANPYTHARFARRVGKSDVEYLHLALGARDELVTFMVRRHDDGSPIPDGQGSLLRRPDHAPGYEHVEVDCVRLDSFFADSPFERAAMWIDVEGAVDQVFGGADRVLTSCDFVLVEVESRTVWDGQEWLDVDVERAMRSAGLRPVARDAQSRFQFNVLFVRDEAMNSPGVAERLASWRSSA